jgi:hypothetical protein
MVTAALQGTVDEIRRQVGDSLVALDLWESESALSLAGFGTSPATGPMLHRVTADLRNAAALAGSRLDDYHVLSVAGGAVAVVSRPHLSAALLFTDEAELAWVLTDVVPAVRAALDAASV